MANETPGLVGPPMERPLDDIIEYYHRWLDRDGFPYHPFFSHNQSWWDVRELRNVLLVHFNNLKADLPGQMRRIAEFLEIEIDESVFPQMVEHCTFDYMKAHADDLTPLLSEVFVGGGKNFINKGTNGRWRDRLTAADVQKNEDIAAREMTPDCAHWIATGEMP
jgi:aryl sulfotransferase